MDGAKEDEESNREAAKGREDGRKEGEGIERVRAEKGRAHGRKERKDGGWVGGWVGEEYKAPRKVMESPRIWHDSTFGRYMMR